MSIKHGFGIFELNLLHKMEDYIFLQELNLL